MTTETIQSPVAGVPLKAAWGAAVADALNRQSSSIDSPLTPGKRPTTRDDNTHPHPYKVVPSGSGNTATWKIYLPEGSLTVAGAAVTIGGVGTPTNDWCALDSELTADVSSSAQTLWLIVYNSTSSGSGSGGTTVTAEMTFDTSDYQNIIAAVPVADISLSDIWPCVSKHYLCSALCLGAPLSSITSVSETVITDLSFTTDDDGQIVVALVKKQVRVLASDPVDDDDDTKDTGLYTHTVVIGSTYNTGDDGNPDGEFKFRNQISTGVVVGNPALPYAPETVDVFTATPHSAE